MSEIARITNAKYSSVRTVIGQFENDNGRVNRLLNHLTKVSIFKRIQDNSLNRKSKRIQKLSDNSVKKIRHKCSLYLFNEVESFWSERDQDYDDNKSEGQIVEKREVKSGDSGEHLTLALSKKDVNPSISGELVK